MWCFLHCDFQNWDIWSLGNYKFDIMEASAKTAKLSKSNGLNVSLLSCRFWCSNRVGQGKSSPGCFRHVIWCRLRAAEQYYDSWWQQKFVLFPFHSYPYTRRPLPCPSVLIWGPQCPVSNPWVGDCELKSRVEVPQVISAEQSCFIVLTFFSADSENVINISADQLCFKADQLWFSLLWNIGFSALNSADSALIYSESSLIFTHVGETIKTWYRSPKCWKCTKCSLKWYSYIKEKVKILQIDSKDSNFLE